MNKSNVGKCLIWVVYYPSGVVIFIYLDYPELTLGVNKIWSPPGLLRLGGEHAFLRLTSIPPLGG